ncbi:MAG: EFR1 family ferrodoxin, partial [Oscillospiraceae bacterium]|nr:EFR1 family ferrodoxin [Oscillospiraceae bacterium]
GKKLRMFSNYVVLYNMKENVDEITKASNERLIPIINAIKNKESTRISGLTKIFSFLNSNFIKKVATMDEDYSVNDNCNGCGICEKVCPVRNIELVDNRPQFKHHCENCVACIQFCPQKAINYKNTTQNRRRYTHPEITYQELYEYNK